MLPGIALIALAITIAVKCGLIPFLLPIACATFFWQIGWDLTLFGFEKSVAKAVQKQQAPQHIRQPGETLTIVSQQ